MSVMWFELKGDERLTRRCSTDKCGGQPTWKMEYLGVGSYHCSGCKVLIEGLAADCAALDRPLNESF